MPIYTYRCENCGIQFEKNQKFSDQPLTRCPECSKKSLHKVYTPVGIVFKGSGFYSTDNRSSSTLAAPKNKHSEKKSDSSSETKTSKSSTDSEKKLAAKAETK